MHILSIALAAVVFGPIAPPQSTDAEADSRLCDRAVSSTAGANRDEVAQSLAQPLAQATARDQQPRAAFLRGCQAWLNGHVDRAAAEFETAAKLDASSAVYQFWLGRVYGEQAQKANILRKPALAHRVKEHFERSVALDSNYLDAREGLVEFYLQAPGIAGGSVDKARSEAAEMTRRNPYRGGLESALIGQRVKDSAAVVRAYEGLLSQYPDSTGPYLSYASLAMSRREWSTAWTIVDRLNRVRPAYPIGRYLIGRLAAESGERLDDGEQSLRQYLSYQPARTEPTLASAHWRLGMILERRGNRDGARREYESALSLEPKHKGATDALAKLK